MTASVTNLNISIEDDGSFYLSAADYDADGHLWAIPKRRISAEQLFQVAAILGKDAEDGVRRRLKVMIDRKRQAVQTYEARVQAAEKARNELTFLESILEA